MKRLNIIELFLILLSLGSAIGAATIGMQIAKFETLGRVIEGHGLNAHKGIQNVANSVEAGFNGGAIGLGIISASCIVAITWIEINRLKLK